MGRFGDWVAKKVEEGRNQMVAQMHAAIRQDVAAGLALEPINVTDATFADQVLSAKTPVLVDYWAESCPPCLMAARPLARLAKQFENKVKIVKVDVEDPDVADDGRALEGKRAAKSISIPTFVIYRAGKPLTAGGEVRALIGFNPGKMKELMDSLDLTDDPLTI